MEKIGVENLGNQTSGNTQKPIRPLIDANKGALSILVAIAVDIVGIQLLLFMIVSSIFDLLMDGMNFYALMFVTLCIQISFAGVALFFLRKNRLLYSPIHNFKSKVRRKSTAINCLIAALVTVISLYSFYGLAVLFDALIRAMGYSSASGISFTTTGELVMMFIVVCIAAPIFEELLFRGLLLSGMKKSGFRDATCILLSGLSFSLMHMNPDQTVYQFCLGCACAYITIKSHSLLPAIIAHATNNILAMLIEITGVDFLTPVIGWMFSLDILAFTMPFVVAAAGAAAVFYLGKIMKKTVIKYHGKEEFDIEEDANLDQLPFSSPHYQNPYGQFGQNPYGQQYQQSPYGQNPYGQQYQQNPYGQNPYGQQYQQNPYGQNPYGQQYQQNPYGSQYQQGPYSEKLCGRQYQLSPYSLNPYGQQYQQNPTSNVVDDKTSQNENTQTEAASSAATNAQSTFEQNPNGQSWQSTNSTNGMAYPYSGYGYGNYSPYLQYPRFAMTYISPSQLRKRRDPKGKMQFSGFFAASTIICASIWLLGLFMGIIGY